MLVKQDFYDQRMIRLVQVETVLLSGRRILWSYPYPILIIDTAIPELARESIQLIQKHLRPKPSTPSCWQLLPYSTSGKAGQALLLTPAALDLTFCFSKHIGKPRALHYYTWLRFFCKPWTIEVKYNYIQGLKHGARTLNNQMKEHSISVHVWF